VRAAGLNVANWAFSYNVSNGQTEYVTVASVAANTVTLTARLRFTHRDSYVGLLSRSVRLLSALPATPTMSNRCATPGLTPTANSIIWGLHPFLNRISTCAGA
jgi:hypothetical protein